MDKNIQKTLADFQHRFDRVRECANREVMGRLPSKKVLLRCGEEGTVISARMALVDSRVKIRIGVRSLGWGCGELGVEDVEFITKE